MRGFASFACVTGVAYVILFASPSAFAAVSTITAPSSASVPKEDAQKSDADGMRGGFAAKPLDGSTIRAVEKYVNPSSHELSLAVGIYPFNPYYMGFEGSAAYTYYFNESWAWEAVNATYVFPVNKGLLTDLASLGYTPQQVDRLNSIVQTSGEYVFAYGKALFFKDAIRYFRASVLLGAGVASADLDTRFAITQGLKFEFYVTGGMSWKFEIRNAFTVGSSNSTAIGGGSSTFPSVQLGMGIQL